MHGETLVSTRERGDREGNLLVFPLLKKKQALIICYLMWPASPVSEGDFGPWPNVRNPSAKHVTAGYAAGRQAFSSRRRVERPTENALLLKESFSGGATTAEGTTTVRAGVASSRECPLRPWRPR